MATDRNRRQGAKAANRRAAVAEKRKAELFANSLAGRVAAAARCPLERCMRQEKLFETGLGTVIIARQLPSGLIAAGLFLVDVWCLGAKDVVYKELTRSDFEDEMSALGKSDRLVDIEPACARKLIAGAVAFAATSTFQPSKAYPVVQKLFGDVAASDCGESFVYGLDGRPTYVEGPNDSHGFSRKIIATLERVHGPDGWDATPPTSLSSNLGHLKALIDAYRDTPILKALRAQIEAYDEEAGEIIEHDPDERSDRPAGPEREDDAGDPA